MSRTLSTIERPPASLLWWLYVSEGMGCPEIARMYERDGKTVFWWLKQAGIQTRPRGSDKRVWLKPGHSMNLGRKRTASERQSIREATMRRGGVPYLRNGVHWLKDLPPDANPNWKGGATPERQEFCRSPEWKAAVRTVWRRANACCERCGLDWRTVDRKTTPTFPLHHIVSFAVRELRAVPSNLVLLCRPCHLWVHSRANVERQFLEQAERSQATPSLFDFDEIEQEAVLIIIERKAFGEVDG